MIDKILTLRSIILIIFIKSQLILKCIQVQMELNQTTEDTVITEFTCMYRCYPILEVLYQ